MALYLQSDVKPFSLSSTRSGQENFHIAEDIDELDGNPEQYLLPESSPLDSEKEEMLRKWLASNIPAGEVVIEPDEHPKLYRNRCCCDTVTGTCFCKIFVILYLFVCILISSLYIAIYGPNELFLMSETSPVYDPSLIKPIRPTMPIRFYDNPYTDWTSRKWTYDNNRYADWPHFPSYVSNITDIVSGQVDGAQGVWFLTLHDLYFIKGLQHSFADTDKIKYMNFTGKVNLNLTNSTILALLDEENLFVISSDEVVHLNCSTSSIDYCDVVYTWSSLDLPTVLSSVYSASDSLLWIGTMEGLYCLNTTYHEDNDTLVSLVPDIDGPVVSLAWRSNLIGKQGLGLTNHAFLLTNSSCLTKQDVSFNTGHFVYTGQSNGPGFGVLVVGTPKRIYFYDKKMLWFEWVSNWNGNLRGVVDGVPTSLSFVPTGELYIGCNVSMSRLNINYTIDRIGSIEGLPYNQVISLHYVPFNIQEPLLLQPVLSKTFQSTGRGLLLVGTKKGFSMYDVGSGKFVGYRYGSRWLPGNEVRSIGSLRGGVFVMLTESGVGVISAEDWTLERKATHYLSMIKDHIRSPGIIAACSLSNYKSFACIPCPTNNDGLWTSWLVASEAFRYQVTGDPLAKANSWSFYEGLKFLVKVTDISGYPARSVINVDKCSCPSGCNALNCTNNVTNCTKHNSNATIVCNTSNTIGNRTLCNSTASDCSSNCISCNFDILNHCNLKFDDTWHRSGSMSDWMWKGDTSSDEIIGHVFAYTVLYDLVAETQEEKDDVASSLDEVISYIKVNNYTLMGLNDQVPVSSVWSPNELNHNPIISGERGLNSLQILSALLSAYRITGKEEYLTSWNELLNDSSIHFGLNFINQKRTILLDINYSNDELAFLSYFVYFYSLKMLKETDAVNSDNFFIPLLSLERTWSMVKKERNSAWNAIYSFATDKNSTELLEDLVWSLRSWPLDLVESDMNNSHRLDIQINPECDRNFQSGTQSLHVLPSNERLQSRLNKNPYQLDFHGTHGVIDPGPWLLPYWLAKWTKLL